jgi:CDP-paratose 2-epimerase
VNVAPLSLITGGAGFIGCNLARRLLTIGARVRIFDSLARPGVTRNLQWLCQQFGDCVEFVRGDVRNAAQVAAALDGAAVVYHLAAQVAVTSSVAEPREDFEVNAMGTLNVLEAARAAPDPPVIIFASTNKVYGELADVQTEERNGRYTYPDLRHGIGERQSLDFHSPYGCSKGAADQYVRDYARIYGLSTAVLRLSCTYGTRQFGNEDQGWIAHFVISACLGRPLTIYGDGRQVRDALYVDDLLDAFNLATDHADRIRGAVFNIGGGPQHTISVLELVGLLEARLGRRVDVRFDAWRPGDQRVYISDIRRARQVLGWSPRVPVTEGVDRLLQWVQANEDLLRAPEP